MSKATTKAKAPKVEATSPKASAKSAPKVKAKERGEGGTFDRALLKTNWSAKQVAQVRATHHKVKVGGKEYTSLYKAFVELGLPIWQHQSFRKVLKQIKRAPFDYKGKKLDFAIVGASK